MTKIIATVIRHRYRNKAQGWSTGIAQIIRTCDGETLWVDDPNDNATNIAHVAARTVIGNLSDASSVIGIVLPVSRKEDYDLRKNKPLRSCEYIEPFLKGGN